MTVKELYEWAIKNNAVDLEIVTRDYYGSETYTNEAEIIEYFEEKVVSL